MSRALADLHPCMRDVAAAFLTRCADANLLVVITQTHRTDAEQQQLYDQGRATDGKIVTNAKPGQSAHNPSGCSWGLAFDVAFLDGGTVTWDEPIPGAWDCIGAIGESLGLLWGGRWPRFPDRPHFEWPDWRRVAADADPPRSPSGGVIG